MSQKKIRTSALVFIAAAAVIGLGGGIYFANTLVTGDSKQENASLAANSKQDSQSLDASSQNSQASSSSQQPHKTEPTLTEFLVNSLEPKDKVLYIWGGGWNEEDTGGNEEANSMGLAPSWLEFFSNNKDNYVAENHAYDIHNGLDCSGYVGWTLHNTFQDDRDYVSLSENYGDFLSSLGYGVARANDQITEILPGDIMYTGNGHVYIVLGQFEDGSILLMHSSPPGVRMSGTYGIASETAALYQNNGWNPMVLDEYKGYNQFRFNTETLPDPDHLKEMTPDQVVDFLYEKLAQQEQANQASSQQNQ